MARTRAVLVGIGIALIAAIAWWRAAPAAIAPPHVAPPPVVFHGESDAEALAIARDALDRVFATPMGARALERMQSGALAGPLTIELNRRGANYTAYRVPGRELGETIFFDPSSRPLVDTASGREPARAETVLAHELGHAVFKLTSEQAVIDAIENPVRDALGLPRRSHF
jgi:hypothetical protein